MTRAPVAVALLLGVVMLSAGVVVGLRRHRSMTSAAIPSTLRAPDGVRVRVQVLNSTKVRGLARRATMLLRDRGFDVVEMGTVGRDERDTTVVLDLSGHPEWAQRVAAILGSARVEARPDSSRYLDIAVVLGSTWRAPSQPFYP